MTYDNTNRGALFKNKKTKDTQPDYTGKLNVEGKDFELAAWLKTSKKNEKYMSISIQEPRDRTQPAPSQAPAADYEDDSIPF